MNITRFFNLSVSEAEDYIRSCIAKAQELVSSDDIKERLRLTGVNNELHGYFGRIHVRKKSNYVQAYLVHAMWECSNTTKYATLIFKLPRRLFCISLDPVMEIKEIRYGELTFYELDKTRKLKEYIDEYNKTL